MANVTRSILIDADFLKRLDKIAQENHRSTNQEIVKRLEESVKADNGETPTE